MADKEKTFRDFIIQVLAGVTVPILLAILALAFPPLKNFFVQIWNFLSSPATVPWWVIIVLSGFSIVTILGFIKPLRAIKRVKPLDFMDYKEDIFFDVLWKWEYNNGEVNERSLRCYCPICLTRLTGKAKKVWFDEMPSSEFIGWVNSLVLHCDTCAGDAFAIPVSKGYDSYLVRNAMAKVIRQIDRKIKTGEWKSAIEAMKNPETFRNIVPKKFRTQEWE